MAYCTSSRVQTAKPIRLTRDMRAPQLAYPKTMLQKYPALPRQPTCPGQRNLLAGSNLPFWKDTVRTSILQMVEQAPHGMWVVTVKGHHGTTCQPSIYVQHPPSYWVAPIIRVNAEQNTGLPCLRANQATVGPSSNDRCGSASQRVTPRQGVLVIAVVLRHLPDHPVAPQQSPQ